MRKPYRMRLDFTLAAWELGEAEFIHDALLSMSEHLGLNFEGGCIEQMDLADVIDGSPIDKLLAAHNENPDTST